MYEDVPLWGQGQHVIAAGEYGAMPQAARNWAETGALLCEVLAAELEQHRHGSPHTAPACVTALPEVSAGHLQNGSSLQQVPRELQSHISWPEIAPAAQTAQGAGHKSIPEPHAEFASVLCATWRALAPEATCHDSIFMHTQAAEQGQISYLLSSLQAQQGSDRGEDEQSAPSSKRQRVAQSPADNEADAGSAVTGEAAAGTGTDGHAAGDQHDMGPQGLGLDFRLLGEPAGFMSCQGQPSSRPELRAALKAELAASGLSLLTTIVMTHSMACLVVLVQQCLGSKVVRNSTSARVA